MRHTHDYKRHGVIDLYAALEVATGKVTHKLTEAHRAIDFLGFMKKVVKTYPNQELHVILDNSSTHGTPDIEAWLTRASRGPLPLHADERLVAQSGGWWPLCPVTSPGSPWWQPLYFWFCWMRSRFVSSEQRLDVSSPNAPARA